MDNAAGKAKKIEQNIVKDIAVIGIGIRFPGADNVDEFWSNLIHKRDQIGELSDIRKKDVKNFMSLKEQEKEIAFRKGAYLDDISQFDYSLFHISPKEAELMDPNQRIFLEVAWRAIEDAGYSEKIKGTTTGVYVGYSNSSVDSYASIISEYDKSVLDIAFTANLPSVIAGRLSYLLDLKGESMVIDTACSSSLVAVHTACNAICHRKCEMAIAGGCKITLFPLEHHGKIGIESLDGKTHTFDNKANGTGEGEGSAVILLKSYQQAKKDKDYIYAIIKGSAINQDGHSIGLTAPNGTAQQKVLKSAWKDAGVSPDTISYVEVHGTGTKLGDPIEIDALSKAFLSNTSKKQFCAVSAVKTNLGHQDTVSGIAGLVKAILALKNKKIPPIVHLDTPNQKIDFCDSAVYICDRLMDWDTKGVRRCGVSSFGLSGTNCHIVLEEASEPITYKLKKGSPEDQGYHVLMLSAESKELMQQLIQLEKKFLYENKDIPLDDFLFSHHTGKSQFPWRLAIVFQDVHDLMRKLEKLLCGNIQSSEEIFFQKVEDEKTGSIQYLEEWNQDKEKLITLSKHYVEGYGIDFKKYYQYKTVVRCRIPLYPLDRKRCWVKNKQVVSQKLLGTKIVDYKGNSIYQKVFQVYEHWVLKEHTLNGRSLFPGAALIEMSAELGHQMFPYGEVCLKKFTLLEPFFVLEQEKKTVQVLAEKKDGFYAVSILGKGKEDIWVKYAECELHREENHTHEKLEIAWNNQDDAQNLKIKSDNKVVDVGDRWNNINYAKIEENYFFVQLKLASKYESEAKDYYIHPALLDNGINAALRFASDGDFLPFYFEKIRICGPIGSQAQSSIQVVSQNKEVHDFLSYNIKMADSQGNVQVSIEEYVAKRIDKSSFGKVESPLLHEVKWHAQEELKLVGKKVASDIILLQNESEFNKNVKDCFNKAGYSVKVLPITKGYTRSRLQELLANQKLHSKVNLVFAKHNPVEDDGKNNADKIQEDFIETIQLVKLLVNEYSNLQFSCFIVTESACNVLENEKGGNLLGAMLTALFHVVNQENQNITVKCLDFDNNTSMGYLVSEIERIEEDKDFSLFAYRNNVKYTQKIIAVSSDRFSTNQTVIKKNGVCIVTGGTGGIGLEICKKIAELQKGTICIIGKTAVDGDEDEVGKQLKERLESLSNHGANIVYYSCGIADQNAVCEVFQNVQEQFGSISLVLHLAGISGKGYLLSKQESEIRNVIEPKIKGTWILYELCKKHQVSTLLLSSSISSFTGGLGQSDYAAANAYMDSFAVSQDGCATKVISVDWSRWSDTGMAKGIEDREELFYPITKEEGVAAFEKALTFEGCRLITGRINENHAYFQKSAIKGQEKDSTDISTFKDSKEELDMVQIIGREDQNYTKLERHLALVWGETLGLSEVNIFHSIYNQGGDSILATRIMNTAKEKYHIALNISDIFKYSSIYELATYLEQKEIAISEINGNKTIRAKSQYYPLSVEQERIYFLHQLAELKTIYNLPFHTILPKKLELNYLQGAFEILAERHPVLRTVFLKKDGTIVQKVLDKLDLEIECVKLTDGENQDRELELLFKRENEYVFYFSKPLIRVILILLKDASCCLYLNLHHLITDGWSTRILLQELYQIYSCQEEKKQVTLPDVTFTYFDWIQDRKKWMQAEQAKEMEQYWMQELTAPLPVLELPSDFKRPRVQQYQGSFVLEFLDQRVTEKIKELAENSHTTLHVVMLSIYFVLLHKLTGNTDIIVGFPMTLRSRKELEQVVGLFVNTLCIRADLCVDNKFSEFIGYVKEKSYQAYEHNQYPFDEIVMKINPERDLSRTPVFTTFFQFYDDIPQEREGVSLYDFSLYCKHAGEGIELRVEYSTALFRKETAEKYLRYFCRLVEQVIDNTEVKLIELSLLSEEEYRQLAYGFSQTNVHYNTETTLADLLSRNVKEHGSRVAVRTSDDEITYQQLQDESDCLAKHLINIGVQKGQVIPICTKRSIEMLIGIYGIIKAGAAYMPVSPELPKARVEYMLDDCKANIVVLAKEEREQFNGYQCVCLEEFRNNQEITTFDKQAVTGKDLAYVIYTSGSTGNPKGVKIKHHSVINRINWMNKQFPLGMDDIIMQKTTYAFDVSVWEIFWWAYAGISVYLPEPGDEKKPEELVNEIEQFQISVIHFVPTMFRMFLDYIIHFKVVEKLKSLKYIFLSGEELPAEYVNRFYNFTNGILETQLVNLYGPTEATVDVTYFECDRNEIYEYVPIGKPIDNTYLYILDKAQNIQPIGVSGELYISGDGVAEGYINKPELTKEYFVDDPFRTGYKMYRTGDLCSWREDGNILYMGRLDHQVKIRGYRIERGEIEKVLLKCEKIRDAIVIDKNGKDKMKYLCAYVVSEEEQKPDEIKAFLRKYLPEYMVPSYIVVREEFPMLPNGKVNLEKLKEIEIYERTEEIQRPENHTEKLVHKLWAEILERNAEKISTNDNFFDIGGNSIRLMSLCMALNENGWDTLTVAQLFSYPTISTMAQFLDGMNNPSDESKEEVEDKEKEQGDMLKFLLRKQVISPLRELVEKCGWRMEQILLALFAYAVAEYKQQNTAQVQTWSRCGYNEKKLWTLNIDLDGVESIWDLFSIVEKQENCQKNNEPEDYCEKQQVSQLDILFYNRTYGEATRADIVFEYDDGGQDYCFYCSYNVKNAEFQQMKQIADLFQTVVSAFVQEELK